MAGGSRPRWLGVTAAIALPLIVTAIASASDLGPFGPPSLYLLAVVAAAAIGGVVSGLAAAVVSFVGLNFYFTEPLKTLRVSKPQDVVALVVFLVVATIVGTLFARVLAERQRAERQEGELRLLNRLSTRLLSSGLAAASVAEFAQAVTDQLRLSTCAVEVTDDPGLSATIRPHGMEARMDLVAVLDVPIESGAVTLGTMHVERTPATAIFTVADHHLLHALAGLLGLAIERQRLDIEARAARSDAEVSDIRAALFSSVTHDFRTPLASIKAGITGLANTDVALGPDERAELLATVVEETDRLSRLVDNVLNLARARAGDIVVEKELTPFDDVVETVLARLRAALAPFHLVAQIRDELPAVWVDPVQMDQALSNIIENAVASLADGRRDHGRGHRLAGWDPRTGGGSGSGYPAGASEGWCSSRSTGVRPTPAAGKRAWARDRTSRRGCTRREDLGGGRGRHGNGRRHRASRRRADGCLVTRILIVDDEPQIVRALSTNLRADGFEIETSADGLAALDRAATWEPDLIILDLGLPDIDGVEVIRRLRGWSQVPVIVLSARDGRSDKVEALELGADDYVNKPFAIEELLARLRATLRRTTAAAALRNRS